MVATACLLFLTSVMIMGEVILAYNGLSAAAEESVRYAIANAPTSPTPASQTTIEQVAVNLLPQLHLTCTNCTVNGVVVTNGNVTSSWVTDANLTGYQDAKVVINYNYAVKIPFISAVTLHMTATSQMLAPLFSSSS
jgi:Flp pilus assembly protein TadG